MRALDGASRLEGPHERQSRQRLSRGRPCGRTSCGDAKGRWADLAALLRRAARAAPSDGVSLRFFVCAALVLLATAAHAAPYALDFADPAALEAVQRNGRQTCLADEGCVLLRGGGSMYALEATGPGVYHLRFRMIEAEKYQYHVPLAEFFKADAADPESNGYGIIWQPWGLITLTATVGGERVYRREFIDPGRDNRNRYASGDIVDLTLRVPPQGDCVEVYTFRTEPEGEPTCRFILLDLPLEGHFGWRNTKWFSHACIHELCYRKE